MNKKVKWVGILSTAERNHIGLIRVRQNNVNSEVLGFEIIDGNGEPYDLKNRKVLFCTYFDRFAPVEQYAEVIENGKIIYTMNEHDMQKPVRINFAYFKIMDEKDNLVDTTQNFSYDIMPSIESKCGDFGPYIIRLEEVLDAFNGVKDEAMKEMQQIIINFNEQVIKQQQDFDFWFESIKDILESVDPGGILLSEIVDFRYSKMLERHFTKIKDRGDFFDREFELRGINVKWFGAKGDGVTDDTEAIQRAINFCKKFGRLIFPDGVYLVSTEIFISKSIHLIGYNAKIIHTRTEYIINRNSIFYVNNEVEEVTVEGFEADSVADGNKLRISFIANGTYDKSEEFSVKVFTIKNCQLNHLLVSMYGVNTIPRVSANKWFSDDTKQSNRSYLDISKDVMTGSEVKKKIGGWVKGNIFDVYPADSDNFDMLKVSGATKALNVSDNYFINKNVNCNAQIDLYTGGDALKFHANHLYDVRLIRKETGTAVTDDPDGAINLDMYHNNYFECSPEFIEKIPSVIEIRGSLFSLMNNQFKMKNSKKKEDFYVLNIRVEDRVYPGGAGSERPYAYIVSGNQVDLRGTENGIFYRTDSSTDESGGSSVIGNLVVGGKRFSFNPQDKVAALGNVWVGLPSNPEGTSFLNLQSGVALGNISGGMRATILANEAENPNMANKVQRIHDTRIENGNILDNRTTGRILVRGGQTITSAKYYGEGKRLVLIGVDESATVVHSNAIRLKGAVDCKIPLRGFLELEFLTDCWVEVSRSF